MKPIVTSRVIHAPVEVVFQTISDVRNFAKAVPQITHIEFLTEQTSGVGTRFLETRLDHGKEQTVELQVVELEFNRHLRIVSEAGGTLWDTLFSTIAQGPQTELTVCMEIRPRHLLARMINGMIRGMVEAAVVRDMDAVKAYCESMQQD